MQRHHDYTRDRLRHLGERLRSRIYAESRPIDSLLVSGRVDRIPFARAQALPADVFRLAKLGDQFGPLWATYWFRAQTVVPPQWKGRRVDLLWNSHSEATLWMGGRSIQGLNSEPGDRWNPSVRPDAILLQSAAGGDTISFQVEMACNRLFGELGHQAGYYKNIEPYILDQADIAVFDPEAWEFWLDYHVLEQLAADVENELDRAWAGLLLERLNHLANILDIDDRATWPQARQVLKSLYENRNGSAVHELSAVGHAHIDTAWLWPLAETDRKCERTFSTATAYMDLYPDYKFVCSQAYQYQVIKDRNPDLYGRIRAKVKAGQFIPVGGTWIEPDCNIPSGEALARQFVFGQRFFEKEFGQRCREFWNPDVFGYNGQLPQICRLAGIGRFLTQKLSWNRFNKPHHHTFMWEGIDGSAIFTHFPPADTYTATAHVGQLRHNARNYKDHDRSRHSYMLFGFGDGGGGPTKLMIETLRRAKDIQGLPRTAMRSPDEFFTLLEQDNTDRIRIVGELYFEYHRGTYTTQAATKRGNRKSEFLLHDIEFLATVAHNLPPNSTRAYVYPDNELNSLWRLLLLNQFHDILPGSSITLVYEDAARQYAQIAAEGTVLRESAIAALSSHAEQPAPLTPINTIGFAREEVAELPDGSVGFVKAPPYGLGQLHPAIDRVECRSDAGQVTFENQHLKATLHPDGRLLGLIEKSTGRESLAAPGNQLLLYVDEPNRWEAWDVDPQHMETESSCPPAHSCQPRPSNSPLRGEVVFERRIGAASSMRQTVRLDAHSRRLEFHCEVDWHESRRMLKAAFPVNVRSMHATYEMQFGCVERPTHFNTLYDLARYEVPGHKWSDLSEHGFGVALLSESKYGFSTFANIMRLSLLRSPKDPDPQADMGRHTFAYAVLPHAGGWREAGVVAEGYRFNCPVLFSRQPLAVGAMHSFASCDDPNLVLDTIKRADDLGGGPRGVILRLYECHGARGTARVRCALPFTRAAFCNLLEEDIAGEATIENGQIVVPYTPYKIISLKLT